MNELREKDVIEILKTIEFPELGKDLVSLGMVETVELQEGTVTVKIKLTTPLHPMRSQLEDEIKTAIAKRAKKIDVVWLTEVKAAHKDSLPGVKNVVAVGSGKGGVGKSTVAANLAASLALEGASVGLLDADIYGPSQAKMFSAEGKRLMADDEKHILPLQRHGVRLISIANLVERGQALTWRGPILHGTLTQLLQQTLWGELDYLIVDLPPGTGDVQLSLSQLVTLTGAVLVTTPQAMSLLDVERAYTMFRKTHVPVLGIIENMSYYLLPDGSKDYIFGQGGAEAFSKEESLSLFAQIPIASKVRESGDGGMPLVLAEPEHPSAQALRKAARILAGQVSQQAAMTLPVL